MLDNRVTIRIWDHTYNSLADPRINPFAMFFTRGRIGHVSIETSHEYISFWPVSQTGWQAKVAHLFDATKAGFRSSAEEDARLEEAHGNPATWNYDQHEKGDAVNPFNKEENSCAMS